MLEFLVTLNLSFFGNIPIVSPQGATGNRLYIQTIEALRNATR